MHPEEDDLFGLPFINRMGAEAARNRTVLNAACHSQLTYVYHELIHYLPAAPRGFGEDSKMPHEWGSMDSYDDMRNSLRLAAMMMDMLLDPFTDQDTDDAEVIREAIVLSECGICAVADGVLNAANLEDTDEDPDHTINELAKTARHIEKRDGREKNSLFPTSEED
jgi:hypothetical protein